MLHFVRGLGFRLAIDPADPRQIRAILDLSPV
jgi:hypothetical protein